jgi:hypothetical protein
MEGRGSLRDIKKADAKGKREELIGFLKILI